MTMKLLIVFDHRFFRGADDAVFFGEELRLLLLRETLPPGVRRRDDLRAPRRRSCRHRGRRADRRPRRPRRVARRLAGTARLGARLAPDRTRPRRPPRGGGIRAADRAQHAGVARAPAPPTHAPALRHRGRERSLRRDGAGLHAPSAPSTAALVGDAPAAASLRHGRGGVLRHARDPAADAIPVRRTRSASPMWSCRRSPSRTTRGPRRSVARRGRSSPSGRCRSPTRRRTS